MIQLLWEILCQFPEKGRRVTGKQMRRKTERKEEGRKVNGAETEETLSYPPCTTCWE